MIRTFRHKGLRRLFMDDDGRGVRADHSDKLGHPGAIACGSHGFGHGSAGYRLHMKGELKGFYAVTVQANWRVIFRFADGDAQDVDYLDYH